MRLRDVLATAALGLSVALVSSLSAPASAAGYKLLGGQLGTGQRDFRVYNNFTDSQANNNQTPHVNFPGATGAVMAIWKSHVEWSSGPYAGDGEGDPTQANLGDGNANFDNSYQGLGDEVGMINANTHSELNGSSGGVLAFMEPGIGIDDGWRIRYYSTWTWQDGPDNNGGSDLQGVSTHEVGHALGLDHTSTPGATMRSFISGSGVAARSIEPDDIAGIQAIYGVKDPDKPLITSLSGSTTAGQTLIIHGQDFPDEAHIWFTMKDNPTGVAEKVFNVPSTDSGTTISVTIPNNVQPGEVLVKTPAAQELSNAFPIDIISGGYFVDTGPGLGGSLGEPVHTGAGDLTPGSPVGFTMSVSNCPPNAFGVWFWAFGGGGAVPFKQGTFYPVPLLFSLTVFTDGTGGFELPLAWDPTIPAGISFTTQYWCQDPSAPAGASGTNGLRMDLP